MCMYFCSYKTHLNETEQNILLEMCGDAGLRVGNAGCNVSITKEKHSSRSCKVKSLCNFFILKINQPGAACIVL